MNRDEMNEVKSTEADTGFCNHKWLVLGSTLAATSLVGWMTRGKGYLTSGKYATYNLLNAYDHRFYLRNRKDRLSFWGGC